MMMARICPLLLPCSPPAIFGFIITVIINAINGKTLWPKAHVRKEIVKNFPPFAYRYPSSSIIVVVCVLWVIASCSHRGPNIVFSRMTHPMSSKPILAHFPGETATTSGPSRLDMGFSCNYFIPAVTTKAPNKPSVSGRFLRNSSEASKFFTSYIFGTDKASAAFCVFASEMLPRYYFFISAVAFTKVGFLTKAIFSGLCNNSEAIKFSTNHLMNEFKHSRSIYDV